MSVIFWVFDGTLASRQGMWSGALANLAQQHFPDSEITIDDIRPHLKTGFPWHEPLKNYGIRSSDDWWAEMQQVFSRAYRNAGLASNDARKLSRLVKGEFLNPQYWTIYDDVEECLLKLTELGWKQIILSNHVPELPTLVKALGLSQYFDEIISSANVGFEKPYKAVYEAAKARVNRQLKMWMIGDNYKADVEGAELCGIPAILVRNHNEAATRSSLSLSGIADIVGEA
ncbi:HAD-IA family hydrolase [Reinekea forsetii]|nr:HAD-IA family hydrolase [Reinekea forsetii]